MNSPSALLCAHFTFRVILRICAENQCIFVGYPRNCAEHQLKIKRQRNCPVFYCQYRPQIGEQSTNNPSQIGEKSARNRLAIGKLTSTNRRTIGDKSANKRPQIGEKSARNRLKIGEQSANKRPQIGVETFAESANKRPTIGEVDVCSPIFRRRYLGTFPYLA